MVHKNCRTFFMCPPKFPKKQFIIYTPQIAKQLKGIPKKNAKKIT